MLVDSVVYLMEVNNFMSSYNTRKRLCRLALCLGIVAACIMVIVLEMIAGFPPVHAAPLQSLCQSFYVPVALGSGLPVQYEIYGELCNPSSGRAERFSYSFPEPPMVMSTGTSLTSLKPTRMCMRLTQQDIVPLTSTVLVLERVRTLP